MVPADVAAAIGWCTQRARIARLLTMMTAPSRLFRVSPVCTKQSCPVAGTFACSIEREAQCCVKSFQFLTLKSLSQLRCWGLLLHALGALLLLPEGRFSLGAMVTFLKFCKFRERAPLPFRQMWRYRFVRPCVPSELPGAFKKLSSYFVLIRRDLLKIYSFGNIKMFHTPGKLLAD